MIISIDKTITQKLNTKQPSNEGSPCTLLLQARKAHNSMAKPRKRPLQSGTQQRQLLVESDQEKEMQLIRVERLETDFSGDRIICTPRKKQSQTVTHNKQVQPDHKDQYIKINFTFIWL